jgi:surface antigen
LRADLQKTPTIDRFFVDLDQRGAAASPYNCARSSYIQSSAMPTPVKAVFLFVAISAAAAVLPARAQLLGFGIRTNMELTKEDMSIIRQTLDKEVHGKPVGTVAKWNNPESRNSGKITLVRKFVRNGQQCESIDYRLTTQRRPAGPEHYRLSSCLQPDGQWKLI